MRVWSASAISLNESATESRSGSPPGDRRAVSSPPAMVAATRLTSRTGRSTRRPAHTPTNVAATVVTMDVPMRTLRRTLRVDRSSTSAATSKYVACTAGSGTAVREPRNAERVVPLTDRSTGERISPQGDGYFAGSRDRRAAEPLPVPIDGGLQVRDELEHAQRGLRVVRRQQRVADEAGIHERLPLRRSFPLGDKVTRCEQIRRHREDCDDEQRSEGEHERDPESKPTRCAEREAPPRVGADRRVGHRWSL